MTLTEVKGLLTRLGFTELSLVKSDEAARTYTFQFKQFNPKLMKSKPTMAAKGSVAIWELEDVGKIGVSPSNQVVRFIDAGKRTQVPKADDSHLSRATAVPEELEQQFQKAVINPGKRVQFMKNLWTFYNREKFGGRMEMPALKTSNTGAPKGTRMFHRGGPHFTTGMIWVAEYMWNARLPFFLELFLHEMCHQAVWDLDRILDRTEQGHGKDWQRRMTHVGLDPRRFDPTDNQEYTTGLSKAQEEEKRTDLYGPSADPASLKHLRRMTQFEPGDCFMLIYGRLVKGYLRTSGRSFTFTFRRHDSGNLTGLAYPSLKSFEEEALPNLYHYPKGRTVPKD